MTHPTDLLYVQPNSLDHLLCDLRPTEIIKVSKELDNFTPTGLDWRSVSKTSTIYRDNVLHEVYEKLLLTDNCQVIVDFLRDIHPIFFTYSYYKHREELCQREFKMAYCDMLKLISTDKFDFTSI